MAAHQAYTGRPQALVVELGAFLGLSTRWLANRHEVAHLVTVDVWDQGHADRIRESLDLPEFGPVFDQFLANLWPFQRKTTPLPLQTQAALVEIHNAQLRPDLIYVDAGHRRQDVEGDLLVSERLFPEALVVGHDWTWPTVRAAVEDHARATGRPLHTNQTAWRLDPIVPVTYHR